MCLIIGKNTSCTGIGLHNLSEMHHQAGCTGANTNTVHPAEGIEDYSQPLDYHYPGDASMPLLESPLVLARLVLQLSSYLENAQYKLFSCTNVPEICKARVG